MACVFDYLNWRGDLTLSQAPFNDVDNLILSALSYVKLCGIVPGQGSGRAITVAQAAKRYFAAEGAAAKAGSRGFRGSGILLLDALAKSPRFSALLLSDCVDSLDPEGEKQFSAVTVSLGGKSAFVAFRGTDSTLVGWKEDFNMSFLPQVPSQRSAAEYLAAAGERFTALRVGGHSKGGNLAVYAAAHCGEEVQKKLRAVYNNDGPGFSDGLLSSPGYLAVRDRVHTFVPQSSVVGMLMDHEESYEVVRSKGLGILQHDLYSWEVMGPDFCLAETVTDGSRYISAKTKHWLAAMDNKQREQTVDALFDVLSATNAKTIDELSADWLGSAGAALSQLKSMEPGSRRMLFELLGLLVGVVRG